MKLNRMLVISAAILVTLLVGAFALNALAPAKDLKLKVKWRPPTYTLGTPLPTTWIAEIFFAPIRDLNEIDTTTLKLEYTYTPSATPYLISGNPPRLAVPFHGYDVINAIMSETTHMTPGTYQIWLTISGNLKAEYGGNPFSGEGAINLVVPDPSPP